MFVKCVKRSAFSRGDNIIVWLFFSVAAEYASDIFLSIIVTLKTLSTKKHTSCHGSALTDPILLEEQEESTKRYLKSEGVFVKIENVDCTIRWGVYKVGTMLSHVIAWTGFMFSLN